MMDDAHLIERMALANWGKEEYFPLGWQEGMTAILDAIRETHAIVPREPTPDMKMKGAKAITSDHMKKMANYDAAIDCYSAMIEAGEADL